MSCLTPEVSCFCRYDGRSAGPSPFRFGGGRRSHEEQIEAKHTRSLPSFGALRRDHTPTGACLIILCSCSGAMKAARLSVRVFLVFRMRRTGRTSSPCCAWASFYTFKGSPTGGNVDKKGQNGKGCGRCSYRYCGYSAPYLTLTAGDKGIKCLSELPKQCKK